MMSRVLASLLLSVALLSACSGGSRITGDIGTDPTTGCTGQCSGTNPSFLTAADVQQIISQAVTEAAARGVANATVAVIDRVGNVLAVYRRGAAAGQSVLLATRVDAGGQAVLRGGLEGIRLPVQGGVPPLDVLYIDGPAAISKAITATYFSTEGSAISTRTASQLIQDHFNPGEANTPGGPLFGVPFSFLACSEIGASGAAAGVQPGPQRAPLGYAGDPGGFPLYKNGTVVGGIGVFADGLYSIDENVQEEDENLDDEAIAFAGTFGFGAPAGRRADLLGLDGKTGRYTDIEYRDLESDPANAPAFGTLPAGLVTITGYGGGTILPGTAFGQQASGIRPATSADFPALTVDELARLDAFVLDNGAGANRFPATAGAAVTGSTPLTQAEVRQLLASGIDVASRTRSAIRFPYGSKATMSVVVVDHLGNILGIARSRDATIEGTNVALQKTRNAAFFSSPDAGAFLTALPPAQYISTSGATVTGTPAAIGDYVDNLRNFVGDANVLTAARPIAWSSRAVNNFSHPNYPDSIFGAPKGPFSQPGAELGELDSLSQPKAWSAFNSGLPLDLQLNSILQHLLFIASGGAIADVAANSCAGTAINLAGPIPVFSNALTVAQRRRLGDGIVLKPGGFPIYRNGVLIGAFGAAGDGTEQDDIVGFLGLYEGQQALIQAGDPAAPGHAAPGVRVDSQLAPLGVRPRYVVCPQSPLITGNSEGVCNGK
jgi:uncharacterized protein GlcG (DUF336 family)